MNEPFTTEELGAMIGGCVVSVVWVAVLVYILVVVKGAQ